MTLEEFQEGGGHTAVTTESEAGNPSADECPDWAIKKLKSHNNSNTVGWEEFLVEGECPECGSNRLVRAIQTAGAVQCVSCPACDHIIEEP